MTGVVLCGGQSSRMGSDKGLIEYKAITWAGLAIDKLSALGFPVVISLNEQQYQHYVEKFDPSILITDIENLNIYGPLRGILSVHLKNPTEDLLVLACDMPLMNKEVLAFLLEKGAMAGRDVFVFRSEKQTEPLCAVYTAKGLAQVYETYKQGNLKKHSMHNVLDLVNTTYLPLPEHWKRNFKNFNSQEDLSAL